MTDTPHKELLSALKAKDAAKVKELLETHKGEIDVNAPSPSNSYDLPVSLAIKENDIESLRLLLEAGAKAQTVQDEDDSGPETPIIQAIESSGNRVNPKMIALLLKHGADPNTVEGGFLQKRPLFMAAEEGYESIVVLLIEAGAKVDQKDNRDNTAMSAAAEHGHAGTIRILAEEGADLNARDWLGRSPLESALEHSHREAFETLLELGANPYEQGKSKSNLLMFAASGGETSLLERLVKMGFDVNTKNENGDTALHWAAWHGRGDVTDKLLQLGADKTIENKQGETPLQRAENQGHVHVARQLKSHEMRITTEMKTGLSGGMSVSKPLSFASRRA
jgi:ankyrin repeat protein